MKLTYIIPYLFFPILISPQPLLLLKTDVPNGGEITIKLPLNGKTISFELDLYFPISIIDSDNFMLSNRDSLTISSTSTTFPFRYPENYEFTSCNGTFTTISPFQIPFHFYFPNKNSYSDISHTLSFAYHFPDPSFSLVHQLYTSGQILKKQFSFQTEIHNQDNLFAIGGVPSQYIENKNKATIHVDKHYNDWGFDITSIRYGNDKIKYLHKQHAYIFTNDTDIYVDEQTFEWFKTEVFGKMIEEGEFKICKFGKRRTLCCNEERYSKMENVSFVIQGYEFEFGKEEMFYCDKGENLCHFVIQVMLDKFCVVDESWKIGYVFYMKFVMLFDYDESTISFYWDKGVKYTGEGMRNIEAEMKVVLWIEIVILIGSIIYLGVVWLRQKGTI